jgi:hypothetical protein
MILKLDHKHKGSVHAFRAICYRYHQKAVSKNNIWEEYLPCILWIENFIQQTSDVCAVVIP